MPPPLRKARAALVRFALAAPLSQVYADLGSMAKVGGRPVVLVANHICVYDSWLGMLVCDRLERPIWIAAASDVLRSMPFLHSLGLFEVRRGTPVATARQLREVGEQLCRDDAQAVLFFPQGGHVRPGLPVEVERGALGVARSAGAPIVPLALHYELFERPRPYGFIRSGTPVTAEHIGDVDLRALLDDTRHRLDGDLLDGTGDYRPLLGSGLPRLFANLPLDQRRARRSQGPLYRRFRSELLNP